MSRAHWILACAVGFEAAWPVLLKFSKGFTVFWASGLMLVAYLASLACLNLACQRLTLSVAYPIWGALGGTLVTLIGVFGFGEPMSAGRACGVVLVIGGAVLVLAGEPQLVGGR